MQIIRFTPTMFEIQHSDHVAMIRIQDVEYAYGSLEDKSVLQIKCPGCGGSASVPISGGSDPDGFQRLAVLRSALDENGTKSERLNKARKKIKKMIKDVDPDRWRAEIDDEDDTSIIKIKERREKRDQELADAMKKWDDEAPARAKAEQDAKDEAERVRLQEIKDAKAAMQKRIDEQAKTKTVREALRKQELEDARIAKQEAEAVKTKLRSEKLATRRITR